MKRLIHPYGDLTGGVWLRGNLHTHSTQSDGTRTPQAVIDDYASRGYGFLMLSDHNHFTSDEDYQGWDNRGMVLIPGNEVCGGPHLQHVDADRLVPPDGGPQAILNAIAQAERESGRGFSVVNHPNWMGQFDHASILQMREWTGYIGMEIYNGLITILDGSPYALDKWDMLLSEGRRLWGFANDDAHRPHHVEFGWNVAYVKDRTRAGVVEALRHGRFYCSTGVVISSIEVDGMTVRLETENARRICAVRDVGSRQRVVDDRVIEVTVPDDAKYIRFECWGDGEQFAWTQPFYVEEHVTGPVVSPFLNEWQASQRFDHLTLAEASPEHAATVQFAPLAVKPLDNKTYGMVDVRREIEEKPGVVYVRAEIDSEQAERRIFTLGYDGPLCLWLNGQPIFTGPGINPAIEDQVKLFVDLKQGKNDLLVAFDSNNGLGWGFFAKLLPK